MATKDRAWPRSVTMTDGQWREVRRRAKQKDISMSKYIKQCIEAAMDREDADDG